MEEGDGMVGFVGQSCISLQRVLDSHHEIHLLVLRRQGNGEAFNDVRVQVRLSRALLHVLSDCRRERVQEKVQEGNVHLIGQAEKPDHAVVGTGLNPKDLRYTEGRPAILVEQCRWLKSATLLRT